MTVFQLIDSFLQGLLGADYVGLLPIAGVILLFLILLKR